MSDRISREGRARILHGRNVANEARRQRKAHVPTPPIIQCLFCEAVLATMQDDCTCPKAVAYREGDETVLDLGKEPEPAKKTAPLPSIEDLRSYLRWSVPNMFAPERLDLIESRDALIEAFDQGRIGIVLID